MSAPQRLNELAERRRLLVMESDLHRAIIGLERNNLRQRLAVWQSARERVTAGRPWLIAGSTVAGLLAVRRWKKGVRWIPTAWTALRWIKSITSRKARV